MTVRGEPAPPDPRAAQHRRIWALMRRCEPLEPADEPAARAIIAGSRRPLQRWWPVLTAVICVWSVADFALTRRVVPFVVIVLVVPSLILGLRQRRTLRRYEATLDR